MDALESILPYVAGGADVRKGAAEIMLQLSRNESRELFVKHPESITVLVRYLGDQLAVVIHDAYSALINLSDRADMVELIGVENMDIVPILMNAIVKPNSPFADFACMLLSNLTRSERMCRKLLDIGAETQGTNLIKLVEVFTRENYNTNKCTLQYIAPILSNLTQLAEARAVLMNRQRFVLQRLLPVLNDSETIKRGGVVGTLRNCTFDIGNHAWLLSDDVDIVPYLLLPLMGPEEFDEKEAADMPPEMQYLGPEKEREKDPEIRLMLVESLIKLCATLKGREILKAKQVYPVVRTMHQVEKDEAVDRACNKLVLYFITDETGEDDLSKLEIPQELSEALSKDDAEFESEQRMKAAGIEVPNNDIELHVKKTADGGTMYVENRND